MGTREALVIFCTWLISVMGAGQNLVMNDTVVMKTLNDPADPEVSLVKFRFTQDLEYSVSFTALVYYNWQQGEHTNLVSLVHHLRYKSQFTNFRNIKISNYFIHFLGIQYFFDSISRFHPDENTLDTRMELKIGKNLAFNVFSNFTTCFFNSFNYTKDHNGDLLKTLSASFLTPLLWTFSTGLGWNFPQWGTLSLGLSAAKFTWIRNREVFSQQNIVEFYGVPKGKNHSIEYGFSMHLLVDKDFQNRVHWNCDLLIFKNYEKPVDLVMKNLIGLMINKFLKTSIQTRLFYEREVSKTIQFENMVSLGFYFNL